MPNARVELSIGPAGPVGWLASFPRFRVGGTPGLVATETDERKRNAGNQVSLYKQYGH